MLGSANFIVMVVLAAVALRTDAADGLPVHPVSHVRDVGFYLGGVLLVRPYTLFLG